MHFSALLLGGSLLTGSASAVPRPTFATGSRRTLGLLHHLQPNSWASLQATCSISLRLPRSTTSAPAGRSPAPTAGGHRSGETWSVKSLPMIKNVPTYDAFTAIMTGHAQAKTIVGQIDALIAANGYDGVTIDFEGINAADRPLLTGFIERLYLRLNPQGKLVAIAVAAKTRYEHRLGRPIRLRRPRRRHRLHSCHGLRLALGQQRPRSHAPWTSCAPPPITHFAGARRQADMGHGGIRLLISKNPDGTHDGKVAEYPPSPRQSPSPRSSALPAATTSLPVALVQYTRDDLPASFGTKMLAVLTPSFPSSRARHGRLRHLRLGQEDPTIWDTIATLKQPTPASRGPARPGERHVISRRRGTPGSIPPLLAGQRPPDLRLPTHRGVHRDQPHRRQTVHRPIFRAQPLRIPRENAEPERTLLGLLGVRAPRRRAGFSARR